MATEYLFDFYNILVEGVFGSEAIAILGVAFAIFIMLSISRASIVFMFYWISFYIMVMFSLWFGALFIVAMFLFSFALFAYNLIKLWGGT